MLILREKNQDASHPFPYQVCRYGAIIDETLPDYHYYYSDFCEVCLRISSAEPYAEDWVEDRYYRTPFPMLFLKYPFRRFHYQYLQPRTGLHFSYDLKTYPALFRDLGIQENAQPVFAVRMTPELQRLTSWYLELLRQNRMPHTAERIDFAAYGILREALYSKETRDESGDALLRAASFLEVHHEQHPDMESVAEMFGFSLRNFYRCWKKRFGNSPHEYLMNLKLRHAEKLLTESDLKTEDIAQILGLGDSAYFAKLFQRFRRMTPGEYRRQHRSKEF